MSLSYLSGSILYQFEDVVTVYCSEIFDKDMLSVFVCVCLSERKIILRVINSSLRVLILRLQASRLLTILRHLSLEVHQTQHNFSMGVFLCMCVCVWSPSTLIFSGSSPSAPPEMPLCRRVIPPCLIPSTTAVYKSHYITVSVCSSLPLSLSPPASVPLIPF